MINLLNFDPEMLDGADSPRPAGGELVKQEDEGEQSYPRPELQGQPPLQNSLFGMKMLGRSCR